jgi:hypothetical protein
MITLLDACGFLAPPLWITLLLPPPAPSHCPAESGARDTLNYRLLPAFTTEEATELLAHHLYFNLFPNASADQHPPADEVLRIRREYASTFAFLIAALGTRPRVLAASIDSLHSKKLVPDAELATKGVPIPGAQAAAAWACARAKLLSGGGAAPRSCMGCAIWVHAERPRSEWNLLGLANTFPLITASIQIPRLASSCRRAAAAPSRDPPRHCDCRAGHLRTSRLSGGCPFPAYRWYVWRV